MGKFCGHCGAPIKEGSAFCGKCGKAVNCKSAANVQAKDTDISSCRTETGKFRTKRTLLLLAVVPAICLLAVLVGGILIAGKGLIHSSNTVTAWFEVGDAPVDGAPSPQQVEKNGCAVPVPIPYRDDFLFLGWYYDAEHTQRFCFTDPLEDDITLYAYWSPEDEGIDEAFCNAALSDAVSVLDQLEEAAKPFTDARGYVSRENHDDALNAVASFAGRQQAAGALGFYDREESCVYMETVYGIPILYSPGEEGTSGTVATFDPFSSEFREKGRLASENAAQIQQLLEGEIVSYLDSDVWLTKLESLPDCDVLLWTGHGQYSEWKGSLLVLGPVIPQEIVDTSSFPSALTAISMALNGNYCLVGGAQGSDRLAITGKYIENKLNFSMDQGLVYLSACQSGHSDTLAEAFVARGAETVFVNRGHDDIRQWYTLKMMENILNAMAGNNTWQGGRNTGIPDEIFHPAGEALEIAHEAMRISYTKDGLPSYEYHSFYIREQEDGTRTTITDDAYPEIYGSRDYTLVSGVTGKLICSDNRVDLSKVTVQAVAGDEITPWAGVKSDGRFYVDKLAPGTTALEFYCNQQLLYRMENVTIEKHRYTDVGEVDLHMMQITGVVRDEESQEPIGGATVWLAEQIQNTTIVKTTADENGIFVLQCMPGDYHVYASADGYGESDPVEVTVTGTEPDGSHALPKPILLKEVLVYTVYSEEFPGNNYFKTMSVNIPAVNLDTPEAAELNTRMYNALYPYVFRKDHNVRYFWEVVKDVLTIRVVISDNFYDSDKTVYTLILSGKDTGTEELTTRQRLLAAVNLTEEEFFRVARNRAAEIWDNKEYEAAMDGSIGMFSSPSQAEWDKAKEMTLSDENLNAAELSFHDGNLMVRMRFYYPEFSQIFDIDYAFIIYAK